MSRRGLLLYALLLVVTCVVGWATGRWMGDVAYAVGVLHALLGVTAVYAIMWKDPEWKRRERDNG